MCHKAKVARLFVECPHYVIWQRVLVCGQEVGDVVCYRPSKMADHKCLVVFGGRFKETGIKTVQDIIKV